jgi:hypothetical protein
MGMTNSFLLAPHLQIQQGLSACPASMHNVVLYALGGFSGGLTLYVKEGVLSYEYNLFEITRTLMKAETKLPAGKVKIEVETSYVERKPAGPLEVVLKVNGTEVASGVVLVSAPLSLPPTIASTSASTSDRRWALSTTIRLLSSSPARSKAHTWNTSVPPLSSSRRKCKPMDPFQWRTNRPNLGRVLINPVL